MRLHFYNPTMWKKVLSRFRFRDYQPAHTPYGFVSYFYVLIELNPRLLWINPKAILENTIPSNQFYLVQLFSFPKGLTYILSATYWYPYLLLGISDSYC
jgi:hypothetical protein